MLPVRLAARFLRNRLDGRSKLDPRGHSRTGTTCATPVPCSNSAYKHASVRIALPGWELRDEPAEEGFLAARLHIELARTGEGNDHALATENGRFPAPEFVQLVFHARLERDHVPAIDHEGFAGAERFLMNRAIGASDQRSGSCAAQHEKPFPTKEGARAAPAGIDFDIHAGTEIGARLHDQILVVHLANHDIASQRRSEHYLGVVRGSGKRVLEERLATEDRT